MSLGTLGMSGGMDINSMVSKLWMPSVCQSSNASTTSVRQLTPASVPTGDSENRWIR